MDAVFSDYLYMAALPTGIPIGILEGFKKNLAVLCHFVIEIVELFIWQKHKTAEYSKNPAQTSNIIMVQKTNVLTNEFTST